MSLKGHRSGVTFDAKRDTVRLNQQALDVWELMRSGGWWTLHTLSRATGHPEASISARLRDFRKDRFGSHVVHREHVTNGLWMYRLIPNPDVRIHGETL